LFILTLINIIEWISCNQSNLFWIKWWKTFS